MIRNSQRRIFVAAFGLALSACGGSSGDAAPISNPLPPAPAPAPAPSPSPAPPPVGALSFTDRCAQPSVIKCVGFDSAADFSNGSGGANGSFGFNAGIMPPSGTADYTRATMDTTITASGNGSLRFTIPSNSGSDSSGTYFTNFSSDLSLQFGENSEFYIQWRQRFSPELLSTNYTGGGGWKQIIVGSGDQPNKVYASCTALETVVQSYYQNGFPIMYNSCTGSASHGPYAGFYQPFGGSDFKLQNGRSSPNCLYSQKGSSFFPPVGNCFGYVANEWITFQVRIKTGPRVADEFTNSYVSLWAARQGKASELLLDWGPYNLSAGGAAENQKFGKVWLLPYHTGKSASQAHPTAYSWYDELIISRSRIADPS